MGGSSQPAEVRVAYNAAQTISLGKYRLSRQKLREIAKEVNSFRRQRFRSRRTGEVTPEMIDSLLRHMHANGLSLQDFDD